MTTKIYMVGILEPTRQDIQQDPYFHYPAKPNLGMLWEQYVRLIT